MLSAFLKVKDDTLSIAEYHKFGKVLKSGRGLDAPLQTTVEVFTKLEMEHYSNEAELDQTPLHVAVSENNVTLVKEFIKSGANLEVCS